MIPKTWRPIPWWFTRDSMMLVLMTVLVAGMAIGFGLGFWNGSRNAGAKTVESPIWEQQLTYEEVNYAQAKWDW